VQAKLTPPAFLKSWISVDSVDQILPALNARAAA
jgi:hypothetical protein